MEKMENEMEAGGKFFNSNPVGGCVGNQSWSRNQIKNQKHNYFAARCAVWTLVLKGFHSHDLVLAGTRFDAGSGHVGSFRFVRSC